MPSFCACCPGALDLSVSEPEVQFVKEELPAPDQVTEAVKLQLPKSFYNYLNAKPCSGCIGCMEDDEFDFSKIGTSAYADRGFRGTIKTLVWHVHMTEFSALHWTPREYI